LPAGLRRGLVDKTSRRAEPGVVAETFVLASSGVESVGSEQELPDSSEKSA
jgi:hypothetical protein